MVDEVITQADRDAAKSIEWVQTTIDDHERIAQTFANHRARSDIQASKLVSALERIESQAICVGIRHDLDEADDWLYDIAQEAAAALAAFEETSQ